MDSVEGLEREGGYPSSMLHRVAAPLKPHKDYCGRLEFLEREHHNGAATQIHKELRTKRGAYWTLLNAIQPRFEIQAQWPSENRMTKWLPLTPGSWERYGTEAYVHRQRLDCELILDFDNKNPKLNMKRAIEGRAWLEQNYGIKSESWLTGGKGVHLHAFLAGAKRPHLIGLYELMRRALRTKLDNGVMLHARHMIRGEWSLHEKTGGVKTPLDTNGEILPAITRPAENLLAELAFNAPEPSERPRRRTWES